jgi:prepilin signal peptidase PulO-like enzyme (type II secretory pathway)
MEAMENLLQVLYAEGLGLWAVFFSFWFGACWGSFIQACYHRIPRGISIVHPPSRCPSCQHRLSWWENQPVIGWICLRGHCRHCGVHIPFRYLWVEVACGSLASVMMMFHLESRTTTLSQLIVFLSLSYLYLLMSKIDTSHGVLPDFLTLSVLLPLAFIGCDKNLFVFGNTEDFPMVNYEYIYSYLYSFILCCYFFSLIFPWLRSSLWVLVGAEYEERWCEFLKKSSWFDEECEPKKFLVITSGLLLWLVLEYGLKITWPGAVAQNLVLALGLLLVCRHFGALFAGREALGMGDVKLVMLLVVLHPNGAWLIVLGLACCFGLLGALFQFGFKLKASLPFGPYLCLASWLLLTVKFLGWPFGEFLLKSFNYS